MHVRFTTVIGMPVTDDQSGEDIGFIVNILIHPDTATIEGFFVGIPAFLSMQTLFLPSHDILHFGSRVRIRHPDVLAPIAELVRLQALIEDGRVVLGQKIITEAGQILGVCRDLQFDTRAFQVEWFFPKKWFRWRRSVPRSAVLQVTPDAILVRDGLTPVPVAPADAVLSTFVDLDPA